MEISIIRVNRNNSDQFLKQVIELSDRNSGTLGFFPQGAFEQKANDEMIVVAVENDKVVGYLLFGFNKREQLASIVHLCVEKNQIRRGIAKQLFLYFNNIVDNLVNGIRVHCRIEYEANKLWPKLGFKYIKDISGRSKKGSILKVWRKQTLGSSLNLFSVVDDASRWRLRVALDTNIIADLTKARTEATEGPHAMVADWVTEVAEFYVTSEIVTDAGRDENLTRRNMTLAKAKTFKPIRADVTKQHEYRNILGHLFSEKPQDQSDLMHISWCAADSMEFFITSDSGLLNKNEEIYALAGTKVIHPANFINHIHKHLNSVEYQPRRFESTTLTERKVEEADFAKLVTTFGSAAPSGQQIFRDLLRAQLVDPDSYTTRLILEGERTLALVSWEVHAGKELEVRMLRVDRVPLAPTISAGVVYWLIEECKQRHVECLRITDADLSLSARKVCQDAGFFETEGKIVRWINTGVYENNDLNTLLSTGDLQRVLSTEYCKNLRDQFSRAVAGADCKRQIEFEKRIWPAKLKGIAVPTYIVAIRPSYAMNLFDKQISERDLFGGQLKLLFNAENAYYRSSRGVRMEAPARILWYVTKDSRNRDGSMCLKAASYLDQVFIGKAEDLYGMLQHLGVFTWKDVSSLVRDEHDKDIMAFTFSRTEVFDCPVPRHKINELWNRELNKNFNVLSPLKIPDNLYWTLYKLGTQK